MLEIKDRVEEPALVMVAWHEMPQCENDRKESQAWQNVKKEP